MNQPANPQKDPGADQAPVRNPVVDEVHPEIAHVAPGAGATSGGGTGPLEMMAGEVIDPVAEEAWLRDSFPSRRYIEEGETYETYRPAFGYARDFDARHPDRPYHEVEEELKAGWNKSKYAGSMTWEKARQAVRDVFDYRSAHRYANEARGRIEGKPFDEAEQDLKEAWLKSHRSASLTWDRARDAVRSRYDRGD